MKRMVVIAVATLATGIAIVSAPTVGYADPVVPQQDAPCSTNLANALTWLPDQKVNLVCTEQPGLGYQWKTVTSDYPSSERWLSYGPELTLHGEGTRNYNLKSGHWIAFPQDADSQCIAEQRTVVAAGVVSAPQLSSGEAGQPLSFRVLPNLFSITLKGFCLWTKVDS